MGKIIFNFFIIMILFSCNRNTETEYYDNGDIEAIHIITNGKRSDSSIYYYPNRNIAKILFYLKNDTIFEKDFSENSVLLSEGKNFKKKMTGKWKFYKENGKLDKILEYIDLCDKEYLNQGWYFNENGDTIFDKSNFVNIKIDKDNFKVHKLYPIVFNYNKLFGGKSKIVVYFSTFVGKKFCDIEKIPVIADSSYTSQIISNFSFTKSGKKNLRGVILESIDSIAPGETKTQKAERMTYFDIPVTVK